MPLRSVTVILSLILEFSDAHVSSFLSFWLRSIRGVLIVRPCLYFSRMKTFSTRSVNAQFFGWARNVNKHFEFRIFLKVCSWGFECSRFVVFVILGLPGWWVHGLFDSSFFLASEIFLQREQSRRVVVCFFGWARNANTFSSSDWTRPARSRETYLKYQLSSIEMSNN